MRTLKINHTPGIKVNPYQKQATKVEQAQKANYKDKIEISSEALNLQKLGNVETARQEKVEALKKEVQSGEYAINPGKIAEKMYSYWDEMK